MERFENIIAAQRHYEELGYTTVDQPDRGVIMMRKGERDRDAQMVNIWQSRYQGETLCSHEEY